MQNISAPTLNKGIGVQKKKNFIISLIRGKKIYLQMKRFGM